MEKLPGTLDDYTVTSGSPDYDGVVVSSSLHSTTIPNGTHVYFTGDFRDYRLADYTFVPLDGPVGGGEADPRIAIIEARWPGLIDHLAS